MFCNAGPRKLYFLLFSVHNTSLLTILCNPSGIPPSERKRIVLFSPYLDKIAAAAAGKRETGDPTFKTFSLMINRAAKGLQTTNRRKQIEGQILRSHTSSIHTCKLVNL